MAGSARRRPGWPSASRERAADEAAITIPCGMAVSCVGFSCKRLAGVPAYSDTGIIEERVYLLKRARSIGYINLDFENRNDASMLIALSNPLDRGDLPMFD